VYVFVVIRLHVCRTPNPPKKDKQPKDQKSHGGQLERTMVNSAPVFGKFIVMAL